MNKFNPSWHETENLIGELYDEIMPLEYKNSIVSISCYSQESDLSKSEKFLWGLVVDIAKEIEERANQGSIPLHLLVQASDFINKLRSKGILIYFAVKKLRNQLGEQVNLIA